MASSGVNTRTWRFIVDEGVIHAFMPEGNFISEKPTGHFSHVNMGIALSHIAIAAESIGKKASFEKTPGISHGNMEYVTGVKIN